jgi:glycosyltransferase involved in cell wall biosynthesis
MAASVVVATTAVETPMGAQAYQEAVVARAPAALEALRPGATFARSVARSLRSPLPGTVRLPMGLLRTAGPGVRRTLGALAYPRGSLVHRMDLILPPPAGPDVVTLHDVVAWTFPDEERPATNAPTELRAADAVICVSQFTADQATELLGLRNTVVVHNGVDERYFDPPPLDPGRRTELGLPERYVLYAGGSAARKNLPALSAAWRAVAASLPDWGLVLAGPTSPARLELFAGVPRVTHLGRLADETMPGLVAGAGLVVVPSTYEGFGLPALEAMATGVPLVSSNRSSLPEVVGGCGILVDPTTDGLADGILAGARGGADVEAMVARASRRAREFTWERSAAGHAAVWARLL